MPTIKTKSIDDLLDEDEYIFTLRIWKPRHGSFEYNRVVKVEHLLNKPLWQFYVDDIEHAIRKEFNAS